MILWSRIFADYSWSLVKTVARGVKLIFTGGHMSLAVAFKGPNIILGLYKCKYSLTFTRELLLGRNKVLGQIKQGGGVGFSPWALCLPPVTWRVVSVGRGKVRMGEKL